ncbi:MULTISPECIES: polysaccharide pyruvyl transferase family protein [unclassified Pseudarthrobacter]|uniref:polysaccharide pyruvyl transferase family protein n=1 Tax=unclassified Pseudarthrobacter TaxID=2647000 RepID=UPI003076C711
MKVLVLHAYSADNLGDGLLVRESLDLIRLACGETAEVTVAASHPQTFKNISAHVVDSQPRRRGYDAAYIRTLLNVKEFDLVVGVGGGYMRAGTPVEAAKSLLVHGPQLWAAARHAAKSVYLPQSIGPVKYGLKGLVASRLRKLGVVMLRDDRSMEEFRSISPTRMPDLAAGEIEGPPSQKTPSEIPVLSVREVRGSVPPRLYNLAARLETFDGYIQSTSGGNNDRPATATFNTRRIIDRNELLMDADRNVRVVVAVRLHAALMALRAGHYVVHLAYERKGFGAFDDLGLSEFVHNVNTFSVDTVVGQTESLLTDERVRRDYRQRLLSSSDRRTEARNECISTLRTTAGIND